MRTISILGVDIHDVTTEESHTLIETYLQSVGPHIIVTPNPEIVLYASHHPEYQDALNRSDLSLPDGFGLRLCSSLRHTIPGVDTAEEILKRAGEKKMRIAAIIRVDGKSHSGEIAHALQKQAQNSAVKIFAIKKDLWRETVLINQLRDFAPDILLVGLGFPEQELWLDVHARRLQSVKIAIGVGGAFDFWTGAARRAPAIVRATHFEWLWRLASEPTRLYRIYQALIVFPVTVVLLKRKQKTIH